MAKNKITPESILEANTKGPWSETRRALKGSLLGATRICILKVGHSIPRKQCQPPVT